MNALQKLLAPYQAAVSGAPSTDEALAKDPVYATLGAPSLTQVIQAAQNDRGAQRAPSNLGGLLELIVGGNRINPHSADPSHTGHGHVAMEHGIVKLGKYLQGLGFDVGEHPAFGGVAPVHTTNSHHYNKNAIDVNYYGGGRWDNERQALNWLEKYLLKRY